MSETQSPRLTLIQVAGITAALFASSLLVARLNAPLASAALVTLSIVFASLVFIFAARTRKYTRDDYLLILGYGGLAVAILDFFTFATLPGKGIFADGSVNVSTQFWLAGRYTHAYTLLIAPFAAKKRFRAGFVLPAYVFATVVLILSILVFKTFPVCHVAGSGFTPLRVYGEYVICVILLGAAWFTWDYRREVGEEVVSLVVFAIGLLIVGEVAATLGAEKGGDVLLFSHVCKGLAMYFIFHGTVAEGMNRPFRAMRQAREKLRERLAFESLFNELSTDLSSGASPEEVVPVVHDGLFKLADFMDAQRAAFLAVDADHVTVTAAVCRKRFRSPVEKEFPALCEWLGRHVKAGKSFMCEDLASQIPETAETAKAFCEAESIGQCVYVSCHIHARKTAALCLLNRDGEKSWDEASLPRLRLAGELFANALRRVRAYQKTLHLRDELNHVSRTNTMGQLTAALAHEINQPLTAILSNAQVGQRFLDMTPPDTGEVNDILGDIVNDTRRATAIIDNIRRMIKKEKQSRGPVRLSELAERLIGMLGKTISGATVELMVDAGDRREEPLVSVDSTQIQQVILNLIMNGVEAMADTPVEAKRVTVHISVTDPEDAVKVVVRDTGGGIPDDQLATIFEPLVTTKKEGLGMGLAISRGIVDEHGGKLWVESTSRSGTVIAFTVPALSAEMT
ncbi:MAG: MASE3 domain-containing protein [Lentisphaeria bacterium]|nr:MASE3 domain-containing protein [Lentisphaeria bacterium]